MFGKTNALIFASPHSMQYFYKFAARFHVQFENLQQHPSNSLQQHCYVRGILLKCFYNLAEIFHRTFLLFVQYVTYLSAMFLQDCSEIFDRNFDWNFAQCHCKIALNYYIQTFTDILHAVWVTHQTIELTSEQLFSSPSNHHLEDNKSKQIKNLILLKPSFNLVKWFTFSLFQRNV